MDFVTQALRIVESMRYNTVNGGSTSQKAVRTGVETTYTHLTQPTELAADWAGMNYTKPVTRALVGFHRAFLLG